MSDKEPVNGSSWRSEYSDRCNACVWVERDAADHIVVLELSGDLPLGLKVHKAQRDAAVRRLLAPYPPVPHETARAHRVGDHQQAADVADVLRQRLVEIATRPIAGKHVERLLCISSAERRRLTKAGQLPVSGSAAFFGGKAVVTIPTYSPERIEKLIGSQLA